MVATPVGAPSRVDDPIRETIVIMSARRTGFTGRAVIVICVLAALAITLAVPVRELLSQRAEISALSEEVAAAEGRVDDLSAQVADWEDPAFIAAQARTRLRFVFPGEVGYVVLGADDRPLPAEPETVEPDVTDPWFTLIWESMLNADGAGSDGAGSDGVVVDGVEQTMSTDLN